MKKNLLIHAVFLCLLSSCNKSVDNTVEDPPDDPPVEGRPGSLSQIIFIDPFNDSITHNYLFDDENYLLKEWNDQDSTEYTYTRDEEKKVIAIRTIASWYTRITNVYYNNANEIAYVIDSVTREQSKVLDSLSFEYTNGSVTRINTFSLQTITSEPARYKTYEYSGSNISKIREFYLEDGIYKESTIANEYEYDDKINPFFTPDDIRFLDYGALSANNIIQETHFMTIDGNPEPFPEYTRSSEYTYGSDNKPISEITNSGSVVHVVTKRLYFYN